MDEVTEEIEDTEADDAEYLAHLEEVYDVSERLLDLLMKTDGLGNGVLAISTKGDPLLLSLLMDAMMELNELIFAEEERHIPMSITGATLH